MIDRRWVLVALMVMVTILVGLLTVIVIVSPTVEIGAARAGIITAVASGPLGVLVLLLQVQQVAQKVDTVGTAIDGHVQAHVGHTDEQIQGMIGEALTRAGVKPPP